jgi:hypothetical protein
MTLSYKCVIDWDNDQYLTYLANRMTDAVNLFTGAGEIGNLKYRHIGTGGSAVILKSPADDPFASETDYGTERYQWGTGSSLNPWMDIGYDGSSYDVSAGASQTFSAVVWLRVIGTTTASISLMRDGATVLATSASESVNSDWKRFAVTGTTTGGTRNVFIRINRTTAGASIFFQIAGAMIVSGSSAPQNFNAGEMSLLENITSYVMELKWNVGFKDPWKSVSDIERATIKLSNDDKRFSPEYADGPLYGYLKSQRKVRIYASDDGENYTVMYTGWIRSIRPTPDATGVRVCTIECYGPRQFVDRVKLQVPLLEDYSAEQAVYEIIYRMNIPGNTINPSVYPITPGEFDVIYPYIGDNWRDNGVDAVAALTALAKARQGKFFFDREGKYQFLGPQNYAGDSGADVTFDNSMTGMDYRYGEDVKNEVTVVSYRRKASASSTVLLWELDETLTLRPGETQTLWPRFKNENDNITVSGTGITETVTKAAAITYTLEIFSQSAKIVFTNTAATEKNVTQFELRGTKLTAFDEVEITVEDADSVAEFGKIGDMVDSEVVNRSPEAQDIANYRLAIFKDPKGIVRAVSFIAKDATYEGYVVNMGIGSDVKRIKIIEDQTAHEAYYSLIGEDHWTNEGLRRATWYLERVADVMTLDDDVFGLLDDNYAGLN